MYVHFLSVAALLVTMLVSPYSFAADYRIQSFDCTKKDAYWWDRSKSGSEGSSCGCPCNSARYMGLDGTTDASHSGSGSSREKSGKIYYRFPGATGIYTIAIISKRDGECATPYKITVGTKTVSGTVGKGSGEETDSYNNISISSGQEIVVWASSCFPSGYTHGSYNRWRELQFTKTGGGGGGTDPDPTTAPGSITNLQVTATTSTTAAVKWDPGTDATSYNLYWTTTNANNPDANISSTSYTISGLQPNSNYTLWVKSVNGAGMADGVSTSIVTPSASVALRQSKVALQSSFEVTVNKNLRFSANRGDIVSIFTLNGVQVTSKKVSGNGELFHQSLRGGTYLIQHQHSNGTISVRTFRIERSPR